MTYDDLDLDLQGNSFRVCQQGGPVTVLGELTRKANTRIAMFRRLACIMIGTRLLHRHGLRSTYYDLRPTAQSNNLGWKQVETGMPVRNRSIAGMTDGNQPLAVIPTHGIRMPSANSAFSTKPTGNNAKMRHKFH